MNIIIALIIFSVIVIIHELGHFLLAKKNAITVTEFSVGMGPRLFSFEKNGTKYSLKILPFGGSCLMLGEDEVVEDENSFNKKSVWARISVVVAGPIFNFILAFLLAMFVVGVVGYDPAKISNVIDGMPAKEAGLMQGDVITKLNDENIDIYREVSAYMMFDYRGGDLDVTFLRDNKENHIQVTPIFEDGSYKIGVYGPEQREKASVLDVIKYSYVEVKYQIVTTIKSLGMMLRGQVSKDDIAGPVGIVNVIGSVYEQSKEIGILSVIVNLTSFCIFLSANLGIMNLLPIPALDGGRLIFLIIEVFRGKPIDQQKEGIVHLIGFVALMALMVFVMFNDISRLL